MAEFRPFRAYRPVQDKAARIAALPYDVYSRAEACAVVADNPDSFLAIDRAETQFDESVDTYADVVYEKAAQMLRDRIAAGDFLQEAQEAYYIYELTMDGRVQAGIVGCASVDDYLDGVIKKHENTRADKEVDRIRHVDACGAQTGPIFLAYRQTQALRDIVRRYQAQAEAVYDFTSEDGIRHRVLVITDGDDIAAIRAAFAGMQSIYIADGHHRCASAVRVAQKRREGRRGGGTDEADFFLSVCFPDEELMIMDYNRVVHDLRGRSTDQFLAELEPYCTVEREEGAARPGRKGEVGMYLGGRWYRLGMRDGIKSDDPVDGLDVAILQRVVLDGLLDIHDPKTDRRIDFVGGIRGLEELKRRVDERGDGVAFAMYPTSIAELFAVADAGRLMPPKSTWFEPKLRSGLFIHRIA